MGSLFYPQLSSGALAQYPIKKTRLFRTIKNILADGSMILLPDTGYSRLLWNLSYTGLSTSDTEALQAHFAACKGPLHAFTFIDPSDNMLVSSANLSNPAWQASHLVGVRGGMSDPVGRSSAFTLTNNGEASQEFVQTLVVPASFTYCFSIYVVSAEQAPVTLLRRGSSVTQLLTASAGPTWSRVSSAGQINDLGAQFTVGLSLSAGQQITVYGPQLEAQPAPSSYRSTAQISGVYANSHWAIEQLPIAATAPELYSVACSIETAL